MNYQLLNDIIGELVLVITGARVERVYGGGERPILVILNRGREHFSLLLSPDRSLPRMHLVTKKPSAAASRGFGLYLRSHLTGARLMHIGLLNQDRVVQLRFSRQGKEFLLIFELTGSAANLVLADSSATILAVYYPVPPADRAARMLMPGIRYVPPVKRTVLPPAVSPSAAERGAEGARPTDGDHLYWNRTTEIYYGQFIERKQVESLRSELLSRVKKALGKLARLIEALSADLQDSNRAEEYKQAGELILANLQRLEPGKEQAELAGLDGRMNLLQLDPKRSPAGNAELYFKKYKKAKAGRRMISSRIEQAGAEEELLRSVLSEAERAQSGDALAAIRADLAAKGYFRRDAAGKRGRRSSPSVSLFRTIRYDGWEIIIGRSASGNDYVTTKIARDRDLWLHAEGLPGSHVVVKNPRGRDIPPAVFDKAASLAAFYSKGKSAGRVAVAYTLARHVKKPKGAKPGLVVLSERKTIMAVPEES